MQNAGVTGKKIPVALATKGVLYADPFLVNYLLDMIDFMRFKLTPNLRKIAFERMIAKENYKREGDVFYMKNAQPNRTEQQTAQKLEKAGYYVVFPNKDQLKQIKGLTHDKTSRINDVYIYYKANYKQYKAELKTVNGDYH